MEEKKIKFAKNVLRKINDVVFSWFPEEPTEDTVKRWDAIEGEETKIVDVKEAVEKLASSEGVSSEYVDFFYEKMEAHRYACTGVWMYGFKITYKNQALYAKDLHRLEISVVAERNRPVAYVRGKGCSSFYKIPAKKLDDFLYKRDLDARTIRFSLDSIKTFYAFNTDDHGFRYFIEQTPSIIAARQNSASADFWRFDVNTSSNDNDWGLAFAIWEDHLVEAGFGGVYVSDRMTKDDYEITIGGYVPGCYIAREVTRVFNANEDIVKEALIRVNEVRDKFQEVIDAHSDEIYDHMLKKMGLDPAMKYEAGFKNMLHAAEQQYGFDCGWLHFRFIENENMATAVKNASMDNDSIGIYADGSFSLNLPFGTQSTTVQKFQADLATRFIEKAYDEKLLYSVTLD